ncbi:MAG: VapC toxin family PIN domain ribonuclease [Zetaproteobacteria bacterium CG12_big_fil_rev_8_21_14_0_65_54_13]|nr:MAG: VapC toxin family PIN domain ribonuclease [Zetaproteobacteria bacterium CG23_combo_of_CG06-09_8_20_14_all_54_7]PIW47753.1 MAG: VapC toxin family PIN domain ribonuclease [Zetaproteobacteria bacterium CG12_big_fil_rev_8_21_14_0_65_54_13]PIX54488.1 MAG: VapC toxin family PIN domain ribonuclease [Zetaproteobacteria bacterium CG_4_10_14_3_um_filter_54_28]PJA26979.1 MAG: VapC toxin family PIN domain ribonuclease [Zetaproteobacteria bacterium CG_4_9_14_3_um_filter_54_145]
MKALDTNILIRFLVADDEKQAGIVRTLFKQAELKQQKLYVPLLVMLEMLWVLASVYRIPRNKILDAIQNLLLLPVLSFDRQVAVQNFLHSAKKGNEDLSDLLIAHAAVEAGCSSVLTFDKKASGFKYFQLLAD